MGEPVTPYTTFTLCYDSNMCSAGFNCIWTAILSNYIQLKRVDARTLLEEPINTRDLVIHMENEIEGDENGRSENERTDETL